MRKYFICILLIFSNHIIGQQYTVNIGEIRYLSDEKDGTDITNKLSQIISSCNNGDVIVIPAGKFILTDQIYIDKEISIIGNGSDQNSGTLLYKTYDSESNDFESFFKYSTGLSYSNNKIIVSGIYFKSIPSSRYSGGKPVSYVDNCLAYYYLTDFIVTDNIFQYFGGSGIAVHHKDSIEGFNGLIFNNDFLDFFRPELANYGYGVVVGSHYNENQKWILNPEFGSEKFLFVEDNYFRETRHAIAGGSNAKYVFRHNLIEDNWFSHAIDMHGAGNFGNVYSSRVSEIYGNTITNSIDKFGNPIAESTPWKDYPTAIGIRGGEAVVHSNTSKNCRFLINLRLEEPNPIKYPSPYQIGYLSGAKYGIMDSTYLGDHGDGDVFVWNNLFEQKFQEWNKYFISDTSYLKFKRDIQDNIERPDYTNYAYPHEYRNYYYAFIDTFLNNISSLKSSKIDQNSIEIRWNNVLCEDGYYIYKSNDGIHYTIVDSTTKNVTALVLSNLDSDFCWFYVKAFNDSHQSKKSETIRINPNLSSHTNSFMIYPNPSFGIFNIMPLEDNVQISNVSVTDILGKTLYQEAIHPDNKKKIRVSIPNKSKGFYLLSLQIKDSIFNEIIIVN